MLFTHRPFLFYLGTRSCTRFATQIAAVAVGWQVYELTGSAFDLGMIGLVQFVPSALVVFVAGHAADHYDRRWVIALCQLVEALTAAYLALGTFGGWIASTAGLVDLLSVPLIRRKITAWCHALLAVMMLSLASLNWVLRVGSAALEIMSG